MEFKQIYLRENGEGGALIEYAEIESINEASAFPFIIKKSHSLPTHADFVKAMNMLIPVVSKLENYSEDVTNLIEVTGVRFKIKKRKKGVEIFYKRNGFIKKEKTDWYEINTEEVLFDCQPEINTALESLINEAYAYLFEGKHFNSEQSNINFG